MTLGDVAAQNGGVTLDYSSYEQACRLHQWEVPAHYNIALDICDRHPREKLAMIHEHFSGAVREVTWGELQDLSNRCANVLAAQGVKRGDRVAIVLPPTPEAAAMFFATWKLGALLLSMSVLYGDDGIRHRLHDAEPAVLVTDAANVGRFGDGVTTPLLVLDEDTLSGAPTRVRAGPDAGRGPGPALLHLRHDRPREGHRPRPPLHPGPRGVPLLPRHPRR